MADPKYSKGYSAGRKKTEAEMAELRAGWAAEAIRHDDFRPADALSRFARAALQPATAPIQGDTSDSTGAMNAP